MDSGINLERNMPENFPPENLDLKPFFEALSWATLNGLKYEFMESFLVDFGSTRNILSAISFANREWDL